ncbi:MAG: hypothetical protein ACLUMK_11895 [Christensenellales bacterium]
MNLSTVFPGASPKALRKTAVLALILALAAHGFCFFNLTYSGESVMLNAAKGSASQIASGAFLMPLYWRVRGAISAPLWVGLLSSCYLSLTVVLLCGLLGLASPYLIAMLAGSVVLSPSVLSIFAGSIHTADAAFLAFLLASCAAVFCLRVRAGTLLGALLLAAAQAGSFISPSRRIGDCLIQSLLKADESARALVATSSAFCSAPRSAWRCIWAALCCSSTAPDLTAKPRFRLRQAKPLSAHGFIPSRCSSSR